MTGNAARRAHLSVVPEGARKKAVKGPKPRRIELICQECGEPFRYVYRGSGPYRAFCNDCR